MTQDKLTTAAIRLADVLIAENAALQAMDFAAAGRLLADKQSATAEMSAAQAETLYAPEGMRTLARQLTTLADENRRLLEQAIAVQRRVMGTVARAAQRSLPDPQYGPAGTPAARPTAALALRANA